MMLILESLIVELQEGLFEKILEVIPHERIEKYEFPVYRIEANPDLVLYLYQFSTNNHNKNLIFENILPHLHNCIILTTMELLSKKELGESDGEIVMKLPKEVPIIMAAVKEKEMEKDFNEKIITTGLTLGQASKLLFWDPADRKDIKALFKNAWLIPTTDS